MGTRIVLVEDHGLIAHTLSAALGTRGVDVVRVDPNGVDDVVEAVVKQQPDLVLLDLDLGSRGDATSLIAPMVDAGPPVLMVTGVDDPFRQAACVRAGAVGVVSKSVSFEALTDAVEKVLERGTLLSKSERDQMLSTLRAHEASERERIGPFEQLTSREAEVLGLLMRGRSVQDVARDSYVSVATVRTQVRSILTKLGASSQVVAIAHAREVGWVPPQER
jgi:two-component system, NarL family, nitrate/nitrite response regulator NarL